MTKYQIKGTLSEKQIEADVAAYFGWCSQNSPFRLLDTDELETGADKKYKPVCGGIIYMQFKKSDGLKPVSKVKLSNRKNRSKLEDIREFRYKNNLDDDPTLYFKLRDKAKTASDFQHNVLKHHHNPPISYAVYVAPLVLDKDDYYSSLFDSCCRYLLDPFFCRSKDCYVYPYRGGYSYKLIGHVPFLRSHVSIVPHEFVADSNHYYAYSQTAADISWHSPAILEHGVTRLSNFIFNIFEGKLREEFYSMESIALHIINSLRDIGLDFPFEEYIDDPIMLVKKYGKWLKIDFNIKQFLIVRND